MGAQGISGAKGKGQVLDHEDQRCVSRNWATEDI